MSEPERLPCPTRTVSVRPGGRFRMAKVEPGDEVVIRNSGDKTIAVVAADDEVMLGLADEMDALAARVAELERERDALVGLLRGCEWSGSYVDAFNCRRRACPSCGGIRPGEAMVSDYARSIAGHRPGCVLAARLGDAKGGGRVMIDEFEYRPGDRVEKHTGDYRVTGEVRAAFLTRAGKPRYAVEIDAAGGGSFLHIYGPHNLRRAEAGAAGEGE